MNKKNRKLSDNQVKTIKWHLGSGESLRYIANRFSVSHTTIRMIANGVTYKDVKTIFNFANHKTADDYFFNNVRREGDCWIWTGARSGEYGAFNYGREPHAIAHRFSYERFSGKKIPEGYYVCHKCDTPLCVNPDHLFVGTPKDNTRDAQRKGRIPIAKHKIKVKE